VAEAELLFLTNRHEVHHIGNGTHGTEVLDVTALLKNCLKVFGGGRRNRHFDTIGHDLEWW
jgi:hypothetical protein